MFGVPAPGRGCGIRATTPSGSGRGSSSGMTSFRSKATTPLRRAAAYAKERIVFDRPIGQNQAIAHPLDVTVPMPLIRAVGATPAFQMPRKRCQTPVRAWRVAASSGASTSSSARRSSSSW